MEGVIIPISILFAIIGWLTIDKIKAQNKKDSDQDAKIDRLTVEMHSMAKEMRDAVMAIRETLATHTKDIEYILKKH